MNAILQKSRKIDDLATVLSHVSEDDSYHRTLKRNKHYSIKLQHSGKQIGR